MVLNRIRDLLRSRGAAGRDQREALEALEALHLRQLDLLQRVRIEATQALTARRQLEATIARFTETADEQARAARIAVGVESDDHVRELLREELASRRRAEELTPILERLRDQESILMDAVEGLAARTEAFAARKATLLARMHAADATEGLARDAQHLRDQTSAVEHAVVATRQAAADLAAWTEIEHAGEATSATARAETVGQGASGPGV